jgi:hypothetical protein
VGAVLMEGNHMAENVLSNNEIAILLAIEYDAMRIELRDSECGLFEIFA